MVLLTAVAEAGSIESSFFSRGYIGFGIGVPLILGKHYIDSSTEDLTATTLSVLPAVEVNIGKVGFIGDFHGGYGHTFPDTFYLGGELFLEWYTLSTRINLSRTVAFNGTTLLTPEFYQIRIKSAYGLLVHPGWQVTTDSLIYLSLGPTIGRLRNNSHMSFIILPGTPTSTPLFIFEHDKDQRKLGFRTGIGTVLLLSEHWAFRLEYLYTHYGHFGASKVFFKIPLTNNPFTMVTDNSATFSVHAVTANVDFFF